MDSIKTKALNRWNALKSERTPFERNWRDCAEYISGYRGRFQVQTISENRRRKPVYNEEAKLASSILASGMMAGVTSPARPWFKLSTSDPELMDHHNVRVWLDSVTKIMLEVFARSNFYN